MCICIHACPCPCQTVTVLMPSFDIKAFLRNIPTLKLPLINWFLGQPAHPTSPPLSPGGSCSLTQTSRECQRSDEWRESVEERWQIKCCPQSSSNWLCSLSSPLPLNWEHMDSWCKSILLKLFSVMNHCNNTTLSQITANSLPYFLYSSSLIHALLYLSRLYNVVSCIPMVIAMSASNEPPSL